MNEVKLKRLTDWEEGLVKYAVEINDKVRATLIYSSKIYDEMEIRIVDNNQDFPSQRIAVIGSRSILDKLTFIEFQDKVLRQLQRNMERHSPSVK